MTKERTQRGSGNVFADLEIPEPEQYLAKAELAAKILQAIRSRGLTQAAAGRLLGINQPKVSALLNGRLTSFSSERLMRLLTRLGQDVEIVLRAKARGQRRGRIRVVQEAHTS